MDEEQVIISNCDEETIDAGFEFAKQLKLSDTVLLYGDLGAGKTEFCKGICQYFEVENTVTSPTFTIINQYSGIFEEFDVVIYHIDLYRIKTIKEIAEIGLQDFIDDDYSIKLIEWPEKNENGYPNYSYSVYFSFFTDNPNKRKIEINCH